MQLPLKFEKGGFKKNFYYNIFSFTCQTAVVFGSKVCYSTIEVSDKERNGEH